MQIRYLYNNKEKFKTFGIYRSKLRRYPLKYIGNSNTISKQVKILTRENCENQEIKVF